MYEKFGWKYLLTAFIVALWGFALYANGVPLGLDLKGGVEIIYRLDFGGKSPSASMTEDTVKVLRERIDVLGVKELSIRTLGTDKVVVQVPSATDSEIGKIKGQIERAGKLQFKIMVTDQLSEAAKQAEIERVVREKRLGTWKEHDRYDVATWHESPGVSATASDPGNYALLYNYTPSGKAEFVDGQHLSDAYATMDDKGRQAVGFEWDSVGKRKFYELTSNNKGKILAVVLDGQIRSAPVIRSAIGGRGIIEGGEDGWDEKELNTLIVILKAGALPAKPILAYTKRVGAQLGAQAVELGGLAIVGSLVAVALFMVFYYRVRTGIIADIALALNLFLLLGTLSMFGATLTLPGIAGILLTAGMAVDANILIFERIREESARGAALKQAVQAGYDRAFWTIFDANLTTALTAIVLMWVGTGPIKGFGLTLTIGIAVSMFTALFVTRFVFGYLVVKEWIREVSFRQAFTRPEFDFCRHAGKAVAVSLVFIAAGWLVFLARGIDKYGIDFTGGTVIQMRLTDPLVSKQVEQRIAAHFAQLGERVPVEVQRMGAAPGEQSHEWQLRTRMVEGEEEESAAAEEPRTSLLNAVLPRAHAQEPEGDATSGEAPATDEAPAEGDAPAGGDAPAPGEAPAEGDAPADVPAPGDDAPAPAEIEEAASTTRAQDYFEDQIRLIFADLLVDPYPEIDGQPYALTPPNAEGKVRIKVPVNLVPLRKGLQDDVQPITAERLGEIVPRAFRQLAQLVDTTNMAGKAKQENLEHLAGAGDSAGFEVELLPDTDPDDGLTPALFTTFPVTNTESRIQEVIEDFKEGLEKIQEDEAVDFAPAHPFPNIDQVGAAVAKNLKSKAFIATFFCVVFICLYVWLRFDLWSGIAAIVAVGHDVLALLAFLAILDAIVSAAGWTFDAKFNLVTISAFLTLIGYSINDTIVVLDRIREDKALAKTKGYMAEQVNLAINKTLSRTVLTSLTTFLVCAVLFGTSLGGLGSIQGLSAALMFGIVAGTYSSMIIAAPILVANKRRVVAVLGGVAGFMIVTLIGAQFVL